MKETLSGMDIEVNPLQPAKENSPIEFTVDEKVTFVRLQQEANA
jgi:hypothetical protein